MKKHLLCLLLILFAAVSASGQVGSYNTYNKATIDAKIAEAIIGANTSNTALATKVQAVSVVVGGHTTSISNLTAQVAAKLDAATYNAFLTTNTANLLTKADTAAVSLRLAFAPSLANLAARSEAWVHYDGRPWRRVAGTKTAGQPGVGTMFTVSVNGWHYERWITNGRLSLNHDFGAKGDGTTDNTAAINAALAYMNGVSTSFYGRSQCILYSEGRIKFDPTQLVWPTTFYGNLLAVRWEVQGSLSPTKKWFIQYPLNFDGQGGDYNTQFVKGALATINAPTVGDTTIVLGAGVLTASLDWKNMNIIGRRTALLSDGNLNLVGQIHFTDCGFQATSNDSLNRPYIGRNNFWVYFDHCGFVGNAAAPVGAKSIYLIDERPSAGGVGIVVFRNCVSAGRGWMLKNTNGNYNGSGAPGGIAWIEHIHESMPAGERFLTAIGGWNGVLLDQVDLADETPPTPPGLDVPYVRNFQLRNVDQSRKAMQYYHRPESGFDVVYASSQNQSVNYGLKSVSIHEGEIAGAMIGRTQSGGLTHLVGFPLPLSPVATTTNNLTITANQASYDGSKTAYLVTAPINATSTARAENQVLGGDHAIAPGDYIVFGAVVRSTVDSTGVGGFQSGDLLSLNISNGKFALSPNLVGNTSYNTATPSLSYRHGGWVAVNGYVKLDSLNVGASLASMSMYYRGYANKAYYLAGLYARVIPASAGFTEADVIRYIQANASISQAAGKGVLAAPAHMAIKPGVQPTTSLPSAVSAGVGSVMYDETLGKLVVSNGTAWEVSGTSYTLPIATSAVLGGVKAGTGVDITTDGTLSVTATGGGSGDVTLTGTQTLTNKTLSSPIVTGTVNETATHNLTGPLNTTGLVTITNNPLLIKGNSTSNAIRIGSTAASGVGNGSSSGSDNILIGASGVATGLTTGNQNIAVGTNALQGVTSGGSNVAMGGSSLQSLVSSTGNTAIGQFAGLSITGSENTAIGYQAGWGPTSGSQNIIIGTETAQGLTTGGGNTFIGYRAGKTLGSGTVSNVTVLANDNSNNLTTNLAQSNTLYIPGQNVYIGAIPSTTAVNGSKLQVNGSFSLPIAAKTAAYTLTTSDYTIVADATSGAFAVTLPTAVGIAGRIYVIKRISAAANDVTVGTTSSQTIDVGATTYVLSSQYKVVTLQSDGTGWIVIANN